MNKFTFILFIFFAVFGNNAYAQFDKKITGDSIISELKRFYSLEADVAKKESLTEKDSVISVFESIWNSSLDKQEKKTVVEALNYQTDRHFDRNKTIWNFIKLITELKKNNNNDFEVWLNYLNKMMNTPGMTSGQVKWYINGIYDFITEKYLYKSKSSVWMFAEGNYEFDIENGVFVIDFRKSNIEALSTDGDTLIIHKTNGKYEFLKTKWKGKNGYVSWEYFGYAPSKIKADLNIYDIDMKKTGFKADSVSFINKEVLDYPVFGRLDDKASKRAKDQGFYPLFRSYDFDFKIKSKQKNVLFKSGIEMKGPVLKFIGSDKLKAQAEYVKNGKVYFKAEAKEFSSVDSILKSNQAAVTLFLPPSDSVTHPDVSILINNNTFSFTRNHKGTGNLPFFDSYQEVYIKTDNITWNITDTLIWFYSKLGNTAEIRSKDFFTKEDFTKHMMYEQKNPLFQIKKYTLKINSRSFYAQDYAAYVRQSVSGTVHRLMGLWYEGFLDYNPETKYVTVKQKLYDYIKFFFDKKDYDVINVISKGEKRKGDAVLFPLVNAVLNTKTKNMVVYGVDRVILNERKKVGFVPSNKSFVIGKNRDMYFAGRLRVALADFYGKNFKFSYENYDVDVIKGDSLIYRVWDKDFEETGEKDRPVFLKSAIENVTGKIRIDVKTNKSGAKKIAKFPEFISKDTSYVYYDKRNKQGAAYPRETFHFTNYPFRHDSLLYLNKYNLKIPGKLTAGGIVPDFEDTLEVQKDYSLGLLYQTPDEGMDLFSGKISLSAENSTMKSFIRLSNEGLVANGVAKWNNTVITTKNFNLYPDSLTAMADKIEISKYINESTYAEFPEVHGEMVATSWNAEKDIITYKTTPENPVEMYEGKSSFEGVLQYSPEKLTGKGKFTLSEGTLSAEDFKFAKTSLRSDSADIVIRAKHSVDKDVIINNMKSYVDINSSKAVFAARDKKSSVTFVNDKYVSYPKHLLWHTGEGKINMGYNMNRFTNAKFSKEKILLDSTYMVDVCKFDKSLFMSDYGNMKFISTDPAKDSLMFFGSVANYYTGNHKLIVKDVQRIIVADIVVTPSSDVIIDKNGEMEKLLKTTVKARGLHNIAEVDIKIDGSNSYTASSGVYQYEDMNNNLQNIYFDNITYSEQKQATVAHGFVEQYHKFTLNPWFKYYGDVYFNASKDRLRFEGYAKIIHSCENIAKPKWFYFKSEINPDSIYLPLEPFLHSDLENNKARVFADIMSAKDSVYTFPVFLSSDPYGNSESLLSARDSSYYVTYLQDDNKYVITTLDKFNNEELPGNYISLKRSYCIVNAEGKINLSKSIKINDYGSAGNLRYDGNSGEIVMQTLGYLDFFISNKALNILRDRLSENMSLRAVKIQSPFYKKSLYELAGVEKTEKLLSEMSENAGNPKRMPEELKKTIVFTDLSLKWDPVSESYKSFGKIGILSVGGKMINKYVDGHIQIKKRRTGDKIFIYLETGDDEWFFFNFSGSIMRTLSSIHEYNQIIADLKTKEKRFKTDKGTYNYMLTNEETKNLFLYEFTGEHPALDDFDDATDQGDEEEN
ncbi:MAG: hypothetical protein GXO50_06485 [Chlorobi bacterium]|nr:hypothetical protein [Chlorobiota bacterium]